MTGPLRLLDGLTSAVTQTWQMSALTVKMLGKMMIGQASLKNLSGPVTIADYAGQSVRLGLAYYLGFLARQRQSRRAEPAAAAGPRWRTPDVLSFRGCDGTPVSELWLDRLQRGGVAIMLTTMSLALYNDMAGLLGLQ